MTFDTFQCTIDCEIDNAGARRFLMSVNWTVAKDSTKNPIRLLDCFETIIKYVCHWGIWQKWSFTELCSSQEKHHLLGISQMFSYSIQIKSICSLFSLKLRRIEPNFERCVFSKQTMYEVKPSGHLKIETSA